MLVHQTAVHACYLSKHRLKSHLHLQSLCLPDKHMHVSLARGEFRDWRNQCVKCELEWLKEKLEQLLAKPKINLKCWTVTESEPLTGKICSAKYEIHVKLKYTGRIGSLYIIKHQYLINENYSPAASITKQEDAVEFKCTRGKNKTNSIVYLHHKNHLAEVRLIHVNIND